MRVLSWAVGAAAVAYGLLCARMYFAQRDYIYFPTPVTDVSGAQALWVESQGERIKVWAVERPGGRALVYFGGNAENVAANVAPFARAFPDRSLYLVNYRGYGGSSGRPTELGLVADAVAVFDRVRAQHSDVAVMGRSLGSGVAMQLAARRPADRLVLVTPFDSLVAVASSQIRWLPIPLLMRDRFDSVAAAPSVRAPVLVVIAGDDELIGRSHSDRLASSFASGQARVVVVPGVGHNTLDLSPEYLRTVAAFLSGSPATGGGLEQ